MAIGVPGPAYKTKKEPKDMKSSPPLTAVVLFAFAIVLIFGVFSCSDQPAKFKLTVKYGPIGKVIEYKLTSHRVGTAYRNGELAEDFDLKVEGDIIYTCQKELDDGSFVVLEENVWNWDEPVDSGQVRRVTRDYAYKYQAAPNGKMTELKMLGKPSQQWENYVRSFVEQCLPVYPDEEVSAGYQWNQTVAVTLPDSEVFESDMTYIVKGTARKQGYHCAIIEYKGNMAVPLFPDPTDSASHYGVDWIEMNGILYFAIEEGIGINSEERQRVISERTGLNPKTGQVVVRRHEFDAVVSSNMVSIGPG